MASWRLGSARPAAPIVAALLVVLVTGCATAPSGGAPQRLESESGQQQSYVQPLPPPSPGPLWTPTDVVQAFLAASANFELDPAAARQYLAPKVELPWNNVLGQPPVVTVVTKFFPAVTVDRNRNLSGGVSTATVTVKGELLASLSSRGDYLYQSPRAESYTFQLGNYDGTWLIQQLPGVGQNLLLLTESAFEEVFQPRNLYFFGPQDGASQNYLVPDPVYVPIDAATTDATSLATELVEGLLVVSGSQPTWLSSATDTAFPADTTLARPAVTISNATARVSLRVPGVSTPAELSQMYAQLSQTLTSSAYDSPAIVQHVQLVVNGKLEHVGLGSASVPQVGTQDDSLYYASPDLLEDWSAPGTSPAKVMTPDVLPPRSAITAIAVSPGRNPQLAVAVRYLRGCEVFVGRADQATRYTSWQLSSTGGACRSLSWDNPGDLWMVTGSDIWVSQPSQNASNPNQDPVEVDPPTGVPNSQILALRVAPDGVRAAFLEATSHGNKMLLAAVTYGTGNIYFGSGRPIGADIANPTAISWYKPDYLIALSPSTSEIDEVPLTGGPSSALTPVPGGTVAISAAGSDNALAIRTNDGQVYTLSALGDGWAAVPQVLATVEAGPDYPG